MSFTQKILIFIFITTLTQATAFAQFEGSSSSVSFAYGCVGIDGAPIPVGSSMATLCCNSSQQLITPPDPKCMAGFNSINDDAVQGAAASITLAQNILTAASGMNGSVTDNTMITPMIPSIATASVPSVQALGATAAVPTYGSGGTSSGTLANTQNSAGGGGAGGGAGGGGGGLSLGAPSKQSADQANAIAATGDSIDGARVAYVHGSGDKAGGGGYNFGSKDAGISKDGADTINLGDEANGKSYALTDDDGVGVSDDPADYFKRIDRSANLFKIVSNRYFKKKSLWKVKQ